MTSVHFTITSNLGLTLPPSHWTRARSLVGAKWQAIRIQFLQRTYICTAFYILIAWWSVQEAVLFADGIIKYSNILIAWWSVQEAVLFADGIIKYSNILIAWWSIQEAVLFADGIIKYSNILIAWWSVQEAVLFADGIIKYSNISCWWLIGTHNTVTIIRIHCQCKTAVWPQEVTEYQWLICIITWRRINCLKVCFYQNTNTFSNHNSKQPLLM